MQLSQLAQMIGSQVMNGTEDTAILGITTLEEAGPSYISFVSDKKYLAKGDSTQAAAVIVPEGVEVADKPYIPVPQVWIAVLQLLNHFHPNHERKIYTGVHPTAVVDVTAILGENTVVSPNAVVGPNSILGDNVYVGPGVVIGEGCKIGTNVIIYANVTIESFTELGDGVIIQPGAVLGADGFKYEMINGQWMKIPQVGTVKVSANAEVGANSCIDRASYTFTGVGANTKIDNLVQLAHNAQVGANNVIVSQSGIAGSTKIGNYCILAAQVGIADNLTIGDKVVVFAQSGVKDNLETGSAVFGTPAKPFRKEAKIIAIQNKLPEMVQEIARLTKRIKELEDRLAELSDLT